MDPVTLRPFSSRTTSDMNIIVRVDDVEERFEGDLSPSNVRTASTLTLLRKRARTIRSSTTGTGNLYKSLNPSLRITNHLKEIETSIYELRI